METSFKGPHHRISNNLIRYSCSKELRSDSNSQHPEKAHLLKYFPKYYHSLTLKISRQSPLLTKIKSIKKLKSLTAHLKNNMRETLWFNLFKNNRKEIEEMPKITWGQNFKLRGLLKARMTLRNVKFFCNLTRIFLPAVTLRVSSCSDFGDFSGLRALFVKYLCNLRRLRTLDLFIKGEGLKEMNWMLGELDGMNWLLGRLETLRVTIGMNSFQGLYKYKNIGSHLTGLKIIPAFVEFDENLVLIPQMSKNLRFLSLNLSCALGRSPEFLSFLAGIQSLPELVSLEFSFLKDINYFWSCFKPQSTLRYLRVTFNTSGLIIGGLFDMRNLMGYWKDIKEMKGLEFDIICDNAKDVMYVKWFITMVLKKVQKLVSFKCSIASEKGQEESSLQSGEPFFVEKIPHLYVSLERFEYVLKGNFNEFDFKLMKPFKNLKALDYQGSLLSPEGVEEAVCLLEGNHRGGVYSELSLSITSQNSADWLGEAIKKVSKAKRKDSNLKILMNLYYGAGSPYAYKVGFLGEICRAILSVDRIEGLWVFLRVATRNNGCFVENNELMEVMRKHGEIRNLVGRLPSHKVALEYRKVDGEK